MSYDAFISYSHAADGLLAPRLQSALQRFAKPWWKRRAIRVFRDESSLSANPHLWSSITDALDASIWFILLLSPDAAASPWVNDEVAYWLQHKDKDRILPVVTEGEFGPDILPPALTFDDEPRWVDLRFARTETQLDLKNPTFSAATADIASAVRGVPKDELESEEVQQHRRTIRTVWAAGLALIALSVAAAIFAYQSNQNATVAEAAELRATADALAASSNAVLSKDPQLALLLGLEAAELVPGPRSLSALHNAYQQTRSMLQLFPAEIGVVRSTAGGISPDGESIVVVGFATRTVDAYSVDTGRSLWRYVHPTEGQDIFTATYSTDGDSVAVYVDYDPFSVPGDEFTGYVVLDANSGARIGEVDVPACQYDFPFMVGPFIDLSRPIATVVSGGCNPFSLMSDVGLTDPITGEFMKLGEVETRTRGLPTTDDSASRFAAGKGSEGFVVDVATGETILRFGGGVSTLSGDGALLLGSDTSPESRLELWDVSNGTRLWTFSGHFSRAFFSSDETLVYGATYDGGSYVIDTDTGAVLFHLLGQTGRAVEISMSDDMTRLATFGVEEVVVWDTTSSVVSEAASYTTADRPLHHEPGSADVGADTAAIWGWDLEENLWSTSILDLGTGSTRFVLEGGTPSVTGDGKRVAIQPVTPATDANVDNPSVFGPDQSVSRLDSVELRDTSDGRLIGTLAGMCSGFADSTFRSLVESTSCADNETAFIVWDLDFSANGERLVGAGNGSLIVWDIPGGDKVAHLADPAINAVASLSPDGSQLSFATRDGVDFDVNIYDLAAGEITASMPVTAFIIGTTYTPDGQTLLVATDRSTVLVVDVGSGTIRAEVPAHQGGAVTDVAASPDGERFATTGFDAFVRTWRVADGALETETALAWRTTSNVEYLDNDTLFVVGEAESRAVTITLDAARLIAASRAKVVRAFTDFECTTYAIDPCPTLDEIKAR